VYIFSYWIYVLPGVIKQFPLCGLTEVVFVSGAPLGVGQVSVTVAGNSHVKPVRALPERTAG
jgi:hypothetical protein